MIIKRNNRKGRSPVARLRTEVLESRTMMAGDVAVHIVNGNLIVEGDVEGNRIAIASGPTPGSFVVGGLPSDNGDVTTVNGHTERVPFVGIRGNILVGMGGGNDVVNVPNLLAPANVSIRLGGGHDRVHLGVPPADGTDPMTPTVRARGAIEIALGEGNDGASLIGVEAQFVAVVGGEDADHIGLNGVHAVRGISVNGGQGDDQLDLHRLRTGLLEVAGEAGNDHVRVTTADVRLLAIGMGAGDDSLAIGDSRAMFVALIGGEGDDTLTNLQGNRFGHVFIRSFEHRGDGQVKDSGDSTGTEAASTEDIFALI